MAEESKKPTPAAASTPANRGSRFKPGAMSTGFDPSILSHPDGPGLQVQVYHIPTKQTVEFAAFITDFSDSFSSNWDTQEVFGRPDPVMNFMNTTRTVSLSWDVPAASFDEARKNMAEVNKLIQFLYPTYEEKTSKARVMEGSPLVKIQFQNLLASGRGSSTGTPGLSVDAKAHGLIAAITSCTANPDLEAGFFSGWNEIAPDQERNPDPAKKKFNNYPASQWPKVWNISLSFTVLHDHLMGNDFGDAKGFPYHTEDQASINKHADAAVAMGEVAVAQSEAVEAGLKAIGAAEGDAAAEEAVRQAVIQKMLGLEG